MAAAQDLAFSDESHQAVLFAALDAQISANSDIVVSRMRRKLGLTSAQVAQIIEVYATFADGKGRQEGHQKRVCQEGPLFTNPRLTALSTTPSFFEVTSHLSQTCGKTHPTIA